MMPGGYYHYRRNGQYITVSQSGLSLFDTDGTLLTPVTAVTNMDALDLAGIIVNLALAGWEPINTD